MQREREALRVVDNRVDDLRGERLRRVDGDGVTRVDTGALDMLHDARDDDIDAIGDAIDLDFRALHVAVDENRVVRRDLDGAAHVVAQLRLVVDDLHRAAAEDVRRADHDRVADLGGTRDGIVEVRDADALRARDLRLREDFIEALAVLCAVDVVDRRAEDLDAGLLQGCGEVDGRLAAELDDDALWILFIDDVEHIFRRQRLEIESVGDVEVRRDGLRVVVDDDGLDAHLAQSPDGVYRAVVELDALADADWAGAEHDDLAGVGHADFVLLCLEGRVVVRRGGLELGCTRIDHLVLRQDVHRLADRADLVLRLARDLGDRAVSEADVLRLEHEARRQGFFLELVLDGRDVLDLVEEPLVDLRDRMDLVDRRDAAAQRLGNDEDALVVDAREVLLDAGIVPGVHLVHVQAVHADLERAGRLEDGALEVAVDAHDLARRLHLRAERAVRVDELVERPARELDDAVVEGRLEAGLRLLGDGVRDLIERVADGDLRRDLGDRVARRLRSERRGAADARVDLDDVVAVAVRVECVLRVAAAFDAELADDAERCRAEHLVLVVRQRLRRSDDDGIARVDADRVEVLHVADGDAVVVAVAHDLVLDLFPAGDAALDEHLADHGVRQALDDDLDELFLILGDAAAGAAHRVGRADDDRIPDLIGESHSRRHILDDRALGDRLAELLHRLLEELAVLCALDGL